MCVGHATAEREAVLGLAGGKWPPAGQRCGNGQGVGRQRHVIVDHANGWHAFVAGGAFGRKTYENRVHGVLADGSRSEAIGVGQRSGIAAATASAARRVLVHVMELRSQTTGRSIVGVGRRSIGDYTYEGVAMVAVRITNDIHRGASIGQIQIVNEGGIKPTIYIVHTRATHKRQRTKS